MDAVKGLAKPTITKARFPRGPFFVIRLFQLLCSFVVLGINAFFIYHLYHNSYAIPWEFTLLDIVAAFSVINILVSFLCVCCTTPSAIGIMIIDSLLTIFWAIAFGIYAHSLGSTVTHSCSTTNWGNSDGVRVCNMLKAVFAFALLAIFAHFATFVLGVAMRKREASHLYEPAKNPALHQQDTAYDPLDSRSRASMLPQPPVDHYARVSPPPAPYGGAEPPQYASSPYAEDNAHGREREPYTTDRSGGDAIPMQPYSDEGQRREGYLGYGERRLSGETQTDDSRSIYSQPSHTQSPPPAAGYLGQSPTRPLDSSYTSYSPYAQDQPYYGYSGNTYNPGMYR